MIEAKRRQHVEPRYVDATQGAKYLGISRTAFYENVRPSIRASKVGGLVRFSIADLDKFMRECVDA